MGEGYAGVRRRVSGVRASVWRYDTLNWRRGLLSVAIVAVARDGQTARYLSLVEVAEDYGILSIARSNTYGAKHFTFI